MSAVPLHIKRRFEQRWASRFRPPAPSSSPQNLPAKSPATMEPQVGAGRKGAKKNRPAR